MNVTEMIQRLEDSLGTFKRVFSAVSEMKNARVPYSDRGHSPSCTARSVKKGFLTPHANRRNRGPSFLKIFEAPHGFRPTRERNSQESPRPFHGHSGLLTYSGY